MLACLTLTIQLSAQERKAKKYDKPVWKNIVMVDYHSGKMDRALDIIDNHFKKAAKQAGTTTPMRMVMQTGEYDVLLIWDMKDGIESMNWERSPDSVKWWAALSELEGGADKAQALMDEYQSLIRSATSDLAMVR
jgi:hypothetical protein